MLQPTILTWILIVFGIITCVPLFLAQLVILIYPKGQKAKNILIGKGEDWRNETHFKLAFGMAWADWLLFFPLITAGSVGVIMGTAWGYLLWAGSGVISLYINLVLWFVEKKYVYPSYGPLAYYTYYWGNFVYWGLAVIVYSVYRIIGL